MHEIRQHFGRGITDATRPQRGEGLVGNVQRHSGRTSMGCDGDGIVVVQPRVSSNIEYSVNIPLDSMHN